MDIDSKKMEIKQEKQDEIDVHNVDYPIKQEEENFIEINCHDLKSEINDQEIIGSTTVGTESNDAECQTQVAKIEIKMESPDTYTGQHIEESVTTDTSEHGGTVYSLWYVVKEEPIKEDWDEVTIEEHEVEVKCEKPVSEITRQQFEDMASLELNKLLDIETNKNWSKELHLVDREAQAELFICYNCNYMSHSKKDLFGHLSIGNCESSVMNIKKLKNLSKPSAGVSSHKIISCYCGFKTIKAWELHKHLLLLLHEVIGHEFVTCDNCDKGATPKKRQMKDRTQAERKLFVCNTCNYKATTKWGLTSHTNRNKCNLTTSVDKSFDRPLAYRRQNMSNEYMCTQCNKIFKKKASLDNHIILQHKEYSSSVSSRIHQCKNCDYRTTHKTSYYRHMQTHGASAPFKVHQCKHCDYKTQHSEKKQMKDRAEAGSKLLVCYICNYKASSKFSLISHTIRNKCNLKTSVDKSFARPLAHRRQNMSNEYMCTHCNTTFKKKASLDNHIIKHHMEYSASVSSRVHQCKNCDYRTTHKSSLRRHMQIHPRSLRYEV
nr:unnamed protein product [Callosobruchus analis]